MKTNINLQFLDKGYGIKYFVQTAQQGRGGTITNVEYGKTEKR